MGSRCVKTRKADSYQCRHHRIRTGNGETKYSDIFHPISKGARVALNQSVLNAYDYKLQQMQATEIEIEETQEEAEEAKEYPEPELGM